MSSYILNVLMSTNLCTFHFQEHSVDGQTHTRSIYDIYFPELIATFTGNLLADIMLYPCETVLNRLYLQGTRTIIDNTDSGMGVIPINTKYEGLMDCYKSILMEEGVTGFYKGFGALVLQYAIHAIIIRLAKYLFERISQEFLQSKRATPNKSVCIIRTHIGVALRYSQLQYNRFGLL